MLQLLFKACIINKYYLKKILFKIISTCVILRLRVSKIIDLLNTHELFSMFITFLIIPNSFKKNIFSKII